MTRAAGASVLERVLAVFRFASFWIWFDGQAWKAPFHKDGPFGCGPGMIERLGQSANPQPPLTGLCDWINHEIFVNAVPANTAFVQNVVIPNFVLFGWVVWATELAIAVSFFLGAFVRLGALAALGLSVHLLIGLGASPREWIWSYIMLIMLNILFFVAASGRTYGLDAWIAPRLERIAQRGGLARLLRLAA
jgi:hypothetical protein